MLIDTKMGDQLTNQPLLQQKKVLDRCVSCPLDDLKSFRSLLRWMCVDQSNPWRACLSYSLFFLLTFVVPLASHLVFSCSHCDDQHSRPFDGIVQLSLSSAAALSFLCLSGFVRKYGLRRFLFLDKLCDESEKVRLGYTAQLHRSLKLLALFVLPCFFAECAYKIWWYSTGSNQIPFLGNLYFSDFAACLLQLCSWLYRTSIYFLVCVLFRLICYLQILRLQDFALLFQQESDVSCVLKEHLRIRRHLRIISHRYRIFILFTLLIVTASQLAALLDTTRANAHVNIFRAGELALCSMTLVAGLFILLRSATKITHKAQSVACLAAKWHVCATLDSFDGGDDGEGGTPAAQIVLQSELRGGWDGDDEEDGTGDDAEDDDLDNAKMLLPNFAHTISFQKRQALVTYFENNTAGLTVFGFTLDRTLLRTIFGIELPLVLWLLGKTIGIS
ncbi:hypothetical protein Syun_009829 [Stephania yunnanensis]|uniref:Uncharacterized protein n=1 Tax=Stephania yunnanensis TaxID=152371 RepID=A0AAP0KGB8_9MAGN